MEDLSRIPSQSRPFAERTKKLRAMFEDLEKQAAKVEAFKNEQKVRRREIADKRFSRIKDFIGILSMAEAACELPFIDENYPVFDEVVIIEAREYAAKLAKEVQEVAFQKPAPATRDKASTSKASIEGVLSSIQALRDLSQGIAERLASVERDEDEKIDHAGVTLMGELLGRLEKIQRVVENPPTPRMDLACQLEREAAPEFKDEAIQATPKIDVECQAEESLQPETKIQESVKQ
ncbi:hypothetical protein L596_009561 [Steinernema carpocapsae]|uniref:Uncharacterized protein n=1 Tax=Steinernema carpocapsae TaxID=34508 RepID=A0A4V6A6P9_STECR|nr:hypothetical protein L596_009561 [Steinernema carpocapsae]